MKKYGLILTLLAVLLLPFLTGNLQAVDAYSVSGIILDPDDHPVKGVLLSFRRDSRELGIAISDKNGNWSKAGLSGEVEIIPFKTYYDFNPDSVIVNNDAVVEFNVSYYILEEKTRELTQEYIRALNSIGDNQIVFSKDRLPEIELSEETSSFKKDNILLSRITKMTPAGLLRKIAAVRFTDKQIIVYTEPANLMEAFKELRVKARVSFAKDRLEISMEEQDPDIVRGSSEESSQLPCFGDQLQIVNAENFNITGSVDFTPGIELDIDIANNLFFLKSWFDFEEKICFKFMGEYAREFNIDAIKLLAMTPFDLGPVVLTPSFYIIPDIVIHIGGEVGITVDANQHIALSFQYIGEAGGVGSPEFELLSELEPPVVEAGVSAEVYGAIGPQIKVMFYEFLGPWVTIQSYADLTAGDLWLLELGVKGKAGIESKVLGINLYNYETQYLTIWEKNYDMEDLTIAAGGKPVNRPVCLELLDYDKDTIDPPREIKNIISEMRVEPSIK